MISGEIGFVGAVQFCWDICTGNYSVTGWFWAGAGVDTWFGWIGFAAWIQGDLFSGNAQWLKWINCGECSDCCKEHERWWALGPGWFGQLTGQKTRIKLGPVECGLLIDVSNTSSCHAKIEGVCLMNLLNSPLLGPIGTLITTVVEYLPGDAHAQAGIVGSVALHLCKGKNGGISGDKVELCIGGYVEVGYGLGKIDPAHHPLT
jgi:hypothetical protein